VSALFILNVIKSRAAAKRKDATQLPRETFERLLLNEQARTLEQLLIELKPLVLVEAAPQECHVCLEPLGPHDDRADNRCREHAARDE
jgi:hypothetical protein